MISLILGMFSRLNNITLDGHGAMGYESHIDSALVRNVCHIILFHVRKMPIHAIADCLFNNVLYCGSA